MVLGLEGKFLISMGTRFVQGVVARRCTLEGYLHQRMASTI